MTAVASKECQIVRLLKKAAKIKGPIIPLCSRSLNYPTKSKGFYMCIKCYPNQDFLKNIKDMNGG